MPNSQTAGAVKSVNASNEWVVFTGKLPQAMKRKLKIVAAEMNMKQQEILKEALEQWIMAKGFEIDGQDQNNEN